MCDQYCARFQFGETMFRIDKIEARALFGRKLQMIALTSRYRSQLFT